MKNLYNENDNRTDSVDMINDISAEKIKVKN